jgi:hypothetical protein
VDIDEIKSPARTIGRIIGLAAMTALTGAALYLYARFGTIFLIKLGSFLAAGSRKKRHV